MTRPTGHIHNWALGGTRIYGVMQQHRTRPNLNGQEYHTSPVIALGSDGQGNLVVRTSSGSTYRLISPNIVV